MKKNILIGVFLIALLSVNTSYGAIIVKNNIQIKAAALSVVKDPNFATVIKTTYMMKKNIYYQLYQAGGAGMVANYNSFINNCHGYNELFDYYSRHKLDTVSLINNHVDQVESFCNLYLNDQTLRYASNEIRVQILGEAFHLLEDENFRKLNPGNLSVMELNRIYSSGGTAGRLTSSEALGCLESAVLGAAGAISGIVGTIVAISSGQGLTASTIRSLIKRSIRAGVFTSGAVAIGYMVACLLWQAWD